MIKVASKVAAAAGLVAVVLSAATASAAEPQIEHFGKSIRPILEENCFRCHGPDKQKSDLRIDTLDPDLVEGKDGGKWSEILDALNRGDMPPEDESQRPDPKQRNTVIEWLGSELNRAAVLRRSTGGHVTLRRLTRYEYNNTMRDLLGVELDYAKDLPPDSRGSMATKTMASLWECRSCNWMNTTKRQRRG
jgi:mono/diheme cytochrome c family protein